MGILNVTPDSCLDGGKYTTFEKIRQRARAIIEEGADILDIGGESTRPGALPVTVEEEKRRIALAFDALPPDVPIPISIDTRHAEIADLAIERGATFINDVSGFSCPRMQQLAKQHRTSICVMHMQGTPKTMQQNPTYQKGVVDTLMGWFRERTEQLVEAGIERTQIIIDPGIGFGKTLEDHQQILRSLRKFRTLGFPLLLGLSYKSFLSQLLSLERIELREATLIANSYATCFGADILRVHDVKLHRDLRKISAFFSC